MYQADLAGDLGPEMQRDGGTVSFQVAQGNSGQAASRSVVLSDDIRVSRSIGAHREPQPSPLPGGSRSSGGVTVDWADCSLPLEDAEIKDTAQLQGSI